MRVHNIGRWQPIPLGAALPFRGGEERWIVVEVNCPAATAFYWVEDGAETFIATVTGLERIEFVAGGGKDPVLRYEGDAEPWFVTRDGAVTEIRFVEEPPTFTKIATRRQRNPDLVRIENKMRLNELRREQEWREELARRKAWEAAQNAGNDTGATGAAGGDGQSAPAEPAPVPAPGEAADGAA